MNYENNRITFSINHFYWSISIFSLQGYERFREIRIYGGIIMDAYIVDESGNVLSKSINKTTVLSEILKEQKTILEDKDVKEYKSVLDALGAE